MKRIINIICSWFKKILSFLSIDEGSQHDAPNGTKNQDIYDNLKDLFINGIENESVGERMLYPMSFYILMHEDDYKERKKAFPILTQEIVKAFYQEILNKKEEFPCFEPISKKWVFQFSPCHINSSIKTDDQSVVPVTKGNIVSTATLYNDTIDSFEQVVVDKNVKVSIKCNNSNVIKTANINLKALAGVDILDEGFFTVAFDEKKINISKPGDTGNNIPPKTTEVIIDNTPIAELSYVLKSNDTARYTMRTTQLIISGRNDTRTLSNIFKLDYPNIQNGHVQIKFENKEFYLCAFGDTRLNEKNVELSKRDNLVWIPLANNSDILMNDEVQVKFKKL